MISLIPIADAMALLLSVATRPAPIFIIAVRAPDSHDDAISPK